MGLRDTLQKLVSNAITSQIGDIPITATFTSKVVSDYDPETGAVTSTSTSYDVTAVQTRLNQFDTPNIELLSTGCKLLVPTLQLPIAVDALDDTVTIGDIVWRVQSARADPAGALYTFILAASEGTQVGI